MKVVCSNCEKEMSCIRNSIMVSKSDYRDYSIKIQRGDRYRCYGCGVEVIADLGNEYERVVESIPAMNLDAILFIESEDYE